MQLALADFAPKEELEATAEADWKHDTAVFGKMNKTAFFDVLHELTGKKRIEVGGHRLDLTELHLLLL